MMAGDVRGRGYRRTGGTAAALVAVAVLAAGCGGGGSTTSSAPAATSPTTAGPGPATTGGATATTGGATATTAAGPTTTVAVIAVKAGSLGSSFCSAAKGLKKRESAELQGLTDSPQAIEKLEKEAAAELPEFQRLAPSSLKSAVSIIVTEDRVIYAALQQADFNYAKLPANFDKPFEAAKFTQADDQITSYLTHVCGISPNS